MHQVCGKSTAKCTAKVFRSYRRRVNNILLPLISVASCIVLSCCVFILTLNTDTYSKNSRGPSLETAKSPHQNTEEYQGVLFRHRSLLNATEKSSGEYPPDLFTLEQKQNGAIILHIIGMCYMFLALSIACDEFFVPALAVITEKLDLAEDVAGATFMAAGGSAPELFTSFIGTFADPDSNVGIGTIVGSAVFNVLFVIGMCAVFSKGVLELTWWPLFRDCMFYSIALILLIVFFLGDEVTWWESLLLLSCYFAYVTFMRFNHVVERWLKGLLERVFGSNKVSAVDVNNTEAVNPGVNKTDLYLEKALEYLGPISKQSMEAPCFNFAALQLVVHTIDPLGDASIAAKVTHLKELSTSNVQIPSKNDEDIQLYTYTNYDLSNGTKSSNIHIMTGDPKDMPSVKICNEQNHNDSPVPGMCGDTKIDGRTFSSESIKVPQTMVISESRMELCKDGDDDGDVDSLDDDEKPIDLSWPNRCRDRIVWIIKAPLIFPMYYTMVDVRRPERRNYYPITFIMSIVWIGIFSYGMVWWATEVGNTFNIPTLIMGLTFLAAGTSIPDLITSVLVARKGFGDMAVSSSIGSNLFDITVGLPLPWLSFSAINVGKSVNVSSDGLLWSVLMLFGMLILVVACIALSKWRMSKILGVSMFVLYVIFLFVSLVLYGVF